MLFAMNKATVLSENFRKVMDKVVRSLRLFWNMDDIEMDPLFQSLVIVRGSFLLLTKLDIDLVPWFKRYDFLANSFFCPLASSTHINKIYTFGKFRLLRWCYLLHGLIALMPFSLLIRLCIQQYIIFYICSMYLGVEEGVDQPMIQC